MIALMVLIACAGVLFTAPPGSTIVLIPNPPFVNADGGVSVITIIVTEPAGTPVSDGTVVLCFSDIGTIDAQSKTKNGIARANFVADSRSGTAHITCTSGGPAPASTGTTTATTATGSTTLAPAPTGGGSGTGTATVIVGNVRVVTVILRADPPRITTSNSTHVFASVLDSAGNPVANVPVTFQVTDNIATEFFDATFPIFTNNNGEAENVLRTRRTTAGTAKVKAFAPGNGALVTSAELSIAVQ